MNFLEKIQNLPESKRKIILWAIVIVIGLALLSWWVKNFQQRLKNFQAEELKLPKLEEELRSLPKIRTLPSARTLNASHILEIPEISEKELKEIEAQLKEAEKQVPMEE